MEKNILKSCSKGTLGDASFSWMTSHFYQVLPVLWQDKTCPTLSIPELVLNARLTQYHHKTHCTIEEVVLFTALSAYY